MRMLFGSSSETHLTKVSIAPLVVASPKSSIVTTKPTLADIASYPTIIASPSRPNFKGSIDDWFKEFGLQRNIVISAPCFSVVPMYLETTDSIAFLPSRAIRGLDLVELYLDKVPEKFDVIAAWHPRYNEDALQLWVISLLEESYLSVQNNT